MAHALEKTAVESKLAEFVNDVLMFGQAPDLNNETPLFDLGVLDSMATISLLSFIEKQYAVAVPLEQIQPADLRNISAIADMILRRL
jgi:2-hydroxymuconate-semialdehyde hydrolase